MEEKYSFIKSALIVYSVFYVIKVELFAGIKNYEVNNDFNGGENVTLKKTRSLRLMRANSPEV